VRLAASLGPGIVAGEWREVVADPAVDVVVVATTHRDLPLVSRAALTAGKHVLCEKPLARSAAEAVSAVDAARAAGRVLKVGFNHRHHPAVWEAHRRVATGVLGPLYFARCCYGHGGRPGYDREWRADPDLAGGGELLDQGVHALDLFRWFLGEVVQVTGQVNTFFWDVAPLEDNAFALLRFADGQTGQLHVSWTQWRNVFSFEVFGRDGYANVQGLGGSYGEETLRVGRRRPEGGVPEEEVLRYPGEDRSWEAEWSEFVSAIREARQPLASGEDGLRALQIVGAIYESSRSNRAVRL
jgi:predicted dehydrogenase